MWDLTEKKGKKMKKAVSVLCLMSLFLFYSSALTQAEETPHALLNLQGYLLSWNDGDVKNKIVSFVESVVNPNSEDFVPRDQRKAFFDMDGTLLCEKPSYLEVVVAKAKLAEKVKADPSLASQPVYKAILENDTDYLYKNVKNVIVEAFAGETLRSYRNYCRNFLYSTMHPKYNRPYVEMFYTPMLELMDYLRGNRFKIFVASTSQQEFVRSISREVLKIPQEQIIGVMVGFSLINLEKDEPPIFVRNREYFTPYNADEAKVLRMRERGVLPVIFAFGNSGGDYAMLDATTDSGLPNMVCILDHDDAEREYEYHKLKLLEKARKRNWTIVSMKKDFKIIFRGK